MRTIKINYIPYKKDKKGLTVKNYAFSKISQGIEILENITLLEMKTIMFLTSFQNLPTSSNKTKLRRIDTQDQIIKCINTNRKSFNSTIKSLEKKNYLIITDDEYILNVDQIEKDVQNVWENKVLSILKDDAKFELTAEQQDSFDQLERMISAGIANEKDIKKYNRLKTLLYGGDDKEDDLEANEQETTTNTTTEIKAEEQPKKETTTIEVEETQKEADLDVEKEIEHKDTTSTPEAEKQAETEQKEVIKEDTSNDISKYKNLFNELNSFQIKNNDDEIIETSDKKIEDDNNKKIKTNEMVTQENFKMINELALLEGKEEVAFKIKEFGLKNKYSNEYYQNEALNRFLKDELEKHTIYKEVEEIPLNTLENDESMVMHTKEDAIQYLVEKYGENLKETLEKEFDEFLEFNDDIKYIFNTLNYKYGKRVA